MLAWRDVGFGAALVLISIAASGEGASPEHHAIPVPGPLATRPRFSPVPPMRAESLFFRRRL
jgi:hypothetical protein